MCINIIRTENIAPNLLQKDFSFSNPKLGSVLDDWYVFGRGGSPFPAGKILRMHYRPWHNPDSDRSGHIEGKVVVAPQETDYLALKELAQKDIDLARRVTVLKEISFNTRRFPAAAVSRAMKTYLWALPFTAEPQTPDTVEGKKVFGGRTKDGYGCFLAYMMPLRPGKLETVGGFTAGPSGLIYQVGHMAVVLDDAEYAMYLRCSDSGATQYACVLRKHGSRYIPVAVWTKDVPHIFPVSGYFFAPEPATFPDPEFFGLNEVGDEYAFRLAEHILVKGFSFGEPKTEGTKHLYDYWANMHENGDLGPFGV